MNFCEVMVYGCIFTVTVLCTSRIEVRGKQSVRISTVAKIGRKPEPTFKEVENNRKSKARSNVDGQVNERGKEIYSVKS